MLGIGKRTCNTVKALRRGLMVRDMKESMSEGIKREKADFLGLMGRFLKASLEIIT